MSRRGGTCARGLFLLVCLLWHYRVAGGEQDLVNGLGPGLEEESQEPNPEVDPGIHASEIGILQPKIISGVPAAPGRHPYVVSLVQNPPSAHYCGGVLIGPKTVLTAAQCTARLRAGKVEAHLGGVDLFMPKERRKVVEFFHHPEWSQDPKEGGDLAVLVLDEPSEITPIKLPKRRQKIRKRATALGWGRTSPSGPFSRVLQQGELNYISNRECRDRGILGGGVKDGMMCLGTEGVSVCKGDEGSPVILKRSSNSTDTLVGIVSFQEGECGIFDNPAIYTRIAFYLPWIKSNI